jgi:hypothetical protein
MISKSPISKKSVSFNERVRSRPFLHINDYSDEELHATWLNADDMQSIRREIRCTVEMMRWGDTFDENEYSRSGLEHRTSDGSRIRRENQSAAVNAVLDEQDRQFEGNYLDEQELADIYADCVYSSQVIA